MRRTKTSNEDVFVIINCICSLFCPARGCGIYEGTTTTRCKKQEYPGTTADSQQRHTSWGGVFATVV